LSPLPLDLNEAPVQRAPQSRARWKLFAVIVLLALLAPTPWLVRRGASKLAFFRVRNVVVEGTRYLSPDSVVSRLGIDTLRSVFDDLPPLERKVRTLRQVADVTIRRKLPGTLIISVSEDPPVALAQGPLGLEAVDSVGVSLPIDPALEPSLDLPIANQRDIALTRMLADVRMQSSALFRRISEVSRTGSGDVLLLLTSGSAPMRRSPTDSAASPLDSATANSVNSPDMLRVRARVGVSAARLTDIFPVEFDLRRRGARVAELDLRYRDQVIARVQ
jgi:cell division protein FtsQ